MNDLSLVPMQDIIAEIDRRFDTVCLLVNRNVSEDENSSNYHFKDKIGCLGLIQLADGTLKDSYKKITTDGFEDE